MRSLGPRWAPRGTAAAELAAEAALPGGECR
jgi:hypothetical protein